MIVVISHFRSSPDWCKWLSNSSMKPSFKLVIEILPKIEVLLHIVIFSPTLTKMDEFKLKSMTSLMISTIQLLSSWGNLTAVIYLSSHITLLFKTLRSWRSKLFRLYAEFLLNKQNPTSIYIDGEEHEKRLKSLIHKFSGHNIQLV